jgi:hypothetical protein
MRKFRILVVLAIGLFALASAAPARAVTLTPVCAGGCFDVAIEIDATLNSVQLTMDFGGYVGTASNHPDLEAVAFKLYTNDDVVWTPAAGNPFASYTPGGLSDGGCNGSGEGWDCFAGTFDIIAAGKPELTLNYDITGAAALRDAADSSFKAKFGPQNGWLISEKMIPEPTGAAMFLIGGLVMGSAVRRRGA